MLAKELIALLSKNPELEFGLVCISSWLTDYCEKDKKGKMIEFVNVFGEFKKRALCGEIDLKHERTGLLVTLYCYDICKIVGKRIEKRIVKKPAVPVEMVEVEESVEVPVTNCELETGEVEEKDVILT